MSIRADYVALPPPLPPHWSAVRDSEGAKKERTDYRRSLRPGGDGLTAAAVAGTDGPRVDVASTSLRW